MAGWVLENEISQRGRFNGNCPRKRQDKAFPIDTIELVSMCSKDEVFLIFPVFHRVILNG